MDMLQSPCTAVLILQCSLQASSMYLNLVHEAQVTHTARSIPRQRITAQRFDDVVRLVPPPPTHSKVVVELDDRKAEAGLGTLYEQDYLAATGQAAAIEDKAQPLREEVRRLFQVRAGLCVYVMQC